MERGGGIRTPGKDEDGDRELDDGEVAQVLQVDGMAGDAEEGKPEGKAVDDEEQELQHDDAVDEAREKFLREYRVLFHQLGEIVKTGGYGEALVSGKQRLRIGWHGTYGECEEGEAEQDAYVANKREDPHCKTCMGGDMIN